MTHSTPDSSPLSRPRNGLLVAGFVLTGIALRIWLVLSGRSLLDGDEAVMGIMGYHMATLRHFPLYFYGQNYMGTLEIPLLAILQLPPVEAWRFAVWPVRLTGLLYFVLLSLVHWRLTARFFGERAGTWSVFFLSVAPFFWMDYSMRMRHATLMMAMGELALLLALYVIDAWHKLRTMPLRPWIFLGLVTGLAWWHYQLVTVYFAALVALFILHPGILGALTGCGEDGFHPGRLTRFVALCLCAATAALLPLGLGRELAVRIGYAPLCALPLAGFGAIALWVHFGKKTAEESPCKQPDHAILGLVGGFLMGMLPSLFHLISLGNKLQLDIAQFDTTRFLGELRDVAFADLGRLYDVWVSEDVRFSLVGFASFLVFGLSLYLLFRRTIEARGDARRAHLRGIVTLLVLVSSLLVFNAIHVRPTAFGPRFLVPIYAASSMLLAVLAATLAELAPAGRSGRLVTLTGIIGVAFLLWAPGWLRAYRTEIDLTSGHREVVVRLIRELKERDVRSLDFVLYQVPENALLAFELQFASGLDIRVAEGSVLDRLADYAANTQAGENATATLVRFPTLEFMAREYGLKARDMFGAEAYAGRFEIGEYMVFPGSNSLALERLRGIRDPGRLAWRPDGLPMVLTEDPLLPPK